jgi:hypothetical protein
VNLCPFASDGCVKACLYKSGKGAFHSVQKARINKTKLFINDKETFFYNLIKDLQLLENKSKKLNLKPSARLNGTSDIPFYNMPLKYKGIEYNSIIEMFPNILFYDYTKRPIQLNWDLNYHLTFSKSEVNDKEVLQSLDNGYNVAIPFNLKKGKKLPHYYNLSLPNETPKLIKIIDGDLHDLRIKEIDNKKFDNDIYKTLNLKQSNFYKNVIIGLRVKGNIKDNSNFILDCKPNQIIVNHFNQGDKI